MNTDPNPWQRVSTKIVYKNPWMQVREDQVVRPDGSPGMYGVVEVKDSVGIVALNDQDELYMIRSFSYPSAVWFWGLPGGGGEDQDAETAARRELLEETGISAADWRKLGTTRVSNGLLTERMTIFLARQLSFGERPLADDAGLIEQGRFMSLEAIDQLIESGEVDDAQSITGVYLAHRWLARR